MNRVRMERTRTGFERDEDEISRIRAKPGESGQMKRNWTGVERDEGEMSRIRAKPGESGQMKRTRTGFERDETYQDGSGGRRTGMGRGEAGMDEVR